MGRCVFSRDGTTLVIQLPSGRQLRYRNARLEDRVKSFGGRDSRPVETIVFDGPKEPGEETYGAKLVENIVQAVCRDLMVSALLQCERLGLPVVLHVHDEIVVEVEAERAEEALRQMAEIMSTPPSWAAGFPVEVEGFAAGRYVKKAPAGAPKAKARNGQLLS